MRYVGDIHGRFYEYVEKIQDCTESIQVGDFGVGFQNDSGLHRTLKELENLGNHRFIRGNHDKYEQCRTLPNFIEDGTIENGTLFLGGAWSIDHAYRTEGWDWWRDEEISFEVAENILMEIGYNSNPNVFVTHDCPQFAYRDVLGYEMIIKTRTAQFLEAVWEIHKPDVWIFGHHHVNKDVRIGNTRFICLGELETIDL